MKTVCAVLVVMLAIGGFFSGCGLIPAKEEVREVGVATATALGESVAKQTAEEIKKALSEGGVTREKLASISGEVAKKAVDDALAKFEEKLREKQKQKEENGESTTLIAMLLYAVNEIRKSARDGWFKRAPVDLNKNGVPDDQEKKA